MIPDYKKDRVKEATDIVRLIESTVALRKDGNEFVACCPFHKETSASFKVNPQKQIFHCFGCNETGDVFAWLMKTTGVPFPEALKILAQRANIVLEDESDKFYRPPVAANRTPADKKPARPLDKNRFRKLDPSGAVMQYLTEQRRLQPEILAAYKVSELVPEAVEGWLDYAASSGRLDADEVAQLRGTGAIAFPYLEQSTVEKLGVQTVVEKTHFVKILLTRRLGKKKIEWREPAGASSTLFGMVAAEAMYRLKPHRGLVICEGEIDALSWAQYEWPAVSVPNGAGSLNWIDQCWPYLERFAKIHLSFDSDATGQKHQREIVERLGIERCAIVQLPEKAA